MRGQRTEDREGGFTVELIDSNLHPKKTKMPCIDAVRRCLNFDLDDLKVAAIDGIELFDSI
ncbi:hypothetical protein [Clostridium sp. JN-1]|uniref:hypothetical protein n=1 Tax=Clostridium sp. JN-1 TaxID=2483110 RepID=UPI000F0B49B0|nr:hypothetical protein [Clostridium sp. JN-1]